MNHPPDDCTDYLRGIKDNGDFDGVGFDHLIFYGDLHPLERDELIGWKGTSINWDLSDGHALEQLLSLIDERRNNEIKFKFGAIRLPRTKLDDFARRNSNLFDYELYPEDGNKYHGHILFSDKLENKRKITICAQLANDIIEIHHQENQ